MLDLSDDNVRTAAIVWGLLVALLCLASMLRGRTLIKQGIEEMRRAVGR